MTQEHMDTDKMWITMGPQHPFSHGLWTLRVKADGEIITEAEPEIGYLHRGWEKECENRTYAKIIPMADRLCYSASMTWSHVYCKVVEEALDIEVPERAQYLRVIADEICRIQSHLMWLAAVGTDLGNLTVFLWALREREFFLDLNIRLCGQRLTTNYPRIGGVRNDMPYYFERDCMRCVERFEKALWEIIHLADDSSAFVSRMKGIGYISRKDIANWGVTGPAMRGCGVDYDVRRDDPYDAYGELEFEVPVLNKDNPKGGDAYSRYMVRIEEMFQSCEMIRQAFNKLQTIPKTAPTRVKVPRCIPAGTHVAKIEDPRGESIMYLVSDGTEKPYRLKVRSPIFVNVSSAP
ncbi:MAG: NADH-quinone oxidoreductase subunit D, partial [Candidatus Methanomethylophilaceae archaeon]|nr:NADH-quinone oxidoreductase subunit D [Candidatus Methanomethylophilaceae archaeon]